mgnify:CR=1 FL=1
MCIRDSAKAAEADAAAAKASLDALVAKQIGFAAEVESRKAAEQAQLAEAEAEQQRLQTLLIEPVSYTHLRAHETVLDLVCRLLLEKKKTHNT